MPATNLYTGLSDAPPEAQSTFAPPPPTISGAEDYEALAPGTEFVDPEGNTRRKPHTYETAAEGEQFVDPEGNTRVKPTYEGVGYTAQTLYDMALTPSEKRKALERSYPGKVQEDAEGLYIADDEGVLRKPGRGLNAVTGFVTSAAAPTVGAIVGSIGGAAAGGPTPAAFVTGMAGGMGGSAGGQWLNDVVLQLAGVYDRTPGEAAGNIALAGVTGGMGAGVGRGIATLVPSVKAGVSTAGAALPGVAAKFLGARATEVTAARELAEKGVMVPPSAYATEAPHLQNVVEVFQPAFHTENVFKESATAHMDKSAKQILEDLGVKTEGSLVEATAAVPAKEAGEKILARTLAASQKADARMAALLEERKAALAAGLLESQAQREALAAAAKAEREKAQALVNQGFERIQSEIDGAMKVAKSGADSGDLWHAVGEQIQGVRRGIMERARKMYDQADALAGEHLPDSSGLSDLAGNFLRQLPEQFQSKYPDIVRKLKAFAGETNPETGEVVREPTRPTFGQLHDLRTQLRQNTSPYDLTPDVRDGTYKFFARRVDEVLHDAKAPPELKAAAKQLDEADKFYREAMGPLNDKNVQAVVSGLQTGLMPDPKALAALLLRENRTDLVRWTEKNIGPQLFGAVKAADLQEMLDLAKGLTPGQIEGRAFVRQVLDRHRNGMLEAVHGKEVSDRLLEQARHVSMLEGKLDVPVKPGDSVTTVIARARAAADAAKAAGEKDPIATLARDTRKLEQEASREAARVKRERAADPLGFLYDMKTGATAAVDKILGDEDLLFAAADRLGRDSTEFKLLQQVHAQRILQGTMEPGKKFAKLSPEAQALMFPGVTLGQMETLAKEMQFLLGTKAMKQLGTGEGMSAMAKVENPWGAVTGMGKLVKPVQWVPGATPAMRATLGGFYNLVTNFMTKPSTLRFIERGLKGTPEEREIVRQHLSPILQRGSAVGAGAAEGAYQGSSDQ